jgi:hypothetical protein
VRENVITLPKKIMEWHVVKILVKLANGGSRFEISTRRAMANELDWDEGPKKPQNDQK